MASQGISNECCGPAHRPSFYTHSERTVCLVPMRPMVFPHNVPSHNHDWIDHIQNLRFASTYSRTSSYAAADAEVASDGGSVCAVLLWRILQITGSVRAWIAAVGFVAIRQMRSVSRGKWCFPEKQLGYGTGDGHTADSAVKIPIGAEESRALGEVLLIIKQWYSRIKAKNISKNFDHMQPPPDDCASCCRNHQLEWSNFGTI